ncbi:c-type cytochrome domain-containing protein [Lentiprolixibacter aurantiacus]|uniref:Cytochrome C Planctomycete-type domain-containing protein n=1 Tax=Lentiprolixibacter aurantiacus TaxID=2993939 RepID=A0AAE3MJA6_9FLAO|nr:c-type cytochrome domain-containing protein [Lentiprolixibacter aurantiacus]MCX2718468.1 hypothetical protein [Lentiprolixibacter aurantiacus]
MEWDLFLGRFHPLLVHLPIGFFILGYIFELLLKFGYRSIISSRKIIILTYTVGLLAGIAAALSGWLLSFSDDYPLSALDDHKLLGILTLVVMLILIFYQIKVPAARDTLKLLGSTIVVILIAATGHLGGNLTHGPDYLVEYGPGILRGSQMGLLENSEVNPDSVLIFQDILKPVLQDKCVACHNSEQSRGGLKLESYRDLFKDAEHGKPVVAGNPEKSELFRRISLPAEDDLAMPPRGNSIGYTNIQILKHWIAEGADSLAIFKSDAISGELIALLIRDYGLDYSPRPYYEKVKADSLSEGILKELRNGGFRANYLGENNFLLDVEYGGDSIGEREIQLLNQVSKNITFLKLSGCKLSDEMLEGLSPIPHLTRADLSKNPLTGHSAAYLMEQLHLEAVNLNDTEIDAEALGKLLSESGIARVYIRNTKVSEDEISSLSQNYADKEIIAGFTFEKVPEAKSVFEQSQEE